MLARKTLSSELCHLCRTQSLAIQSRRQLHQSVQYGRYKTIDDIPRKAEIEVAHKGRLANVVPPKRCIDVTHRVGSKFGGSHSLRWIDPPRTILLVKKANDPKTSEALSRIVDFIRKKHPNIQLVLQTQHSDDLDPSTRDDVLVVDEDTLAKSSSKIDLIVALGGDGTVLNVASMFAGSAVPPVLGISMGSLGFLMPFDFRDFENAFEKVMVSQASLLLRMRLECSVHDAKGKRVTRFEHEGSQVLNEIHLHRGRHPHLTVIDTFVDGQHMTEAIADGLIISTPTGSTAYSLSAGGPIVHPSVPSLLLTPICPRSLSFRSVLLPSDVRIQLRISPKSRAPAELSLDGREIGVLEPHEYLCVSMSKYPVPCIVPDAKIISHHVPDSLLVEHSSELLQEGDGDGGHTVDSLSVQAEGQASGAGGGRRNRRSETDDILDGGWVQDINGMLSFNKAFVTKGMLRHVSEE